MNNALYYIASVLCYLSAAYRAIAAGYASYSIGLSAPMGHISEWLLPVGLAIGGWVFMTKHRQDKHPDVPFQKGPAVSIIGIICFIVGVEQLCLAVPTIVQVDMSANIAWPLFWLIIRPVALTIMGIWFGFMYHRSG